MGRTSDGVPVSDLAPFSLLSSNSDGDSRAGKTYAAAVHGVQAAVAQFCDSLVPDSACAIREFSMQPMLEGDLRRSVATCPQGHMLVADRRKSWQGSRRSNECDLCGDVVPRGGVRMCCLTCNYTVCEICWCWRRSLPMHQNPAYGEALLSAPPVSCSRGHRMERIVGQAWSLGRTGFSCNSCGKEPLGVLTPYFFRCQPCHYNICPACDRLQ